MSGLIDISPYPRVSPNIINGGMDDPAPTYQTLQPSPQILNDSKDPILATLEDHHNGQPTTQSERPFNGSFEAMNTQPAFATFNEAPIEAQQYGTSLSGGTVMAPIPSGVDQLVTGTKVQHFHVFLVKTNYLPGHFECNSRTYQSSSRASVAFREGLLFVSHFGQN